ncbi:alpha/beta hydrolase [Peribacillus muralis]|uniref:alpha/beta hydrolase n=1 Tax=Peribacillus muralis TaxID=264697 RepID=UPI00070A1A14|nr:alpha/beta hydrolase [Peribacillus muralis]
MEENIHPELRDLFSVIPSMLISKESLQGMRESLRQMTSVQGNEKAETIEKYIPGKKGDPDVRVLIHRPKNQTDVLPGLYYIHGGAFVMGEADLMAATCENYAVNMQCVVVNVDYRLAPEHPYPAGLEDCYAGLQWFVDYAAELKTNPDHIVVAGGSAGGGLVAALTLLARDRKGPKIAAQFPLYPMIDDRCESPSNKEITDNRVWNGISNRNSWDMYLSALDENDEVPIYAAPARAKDYSNLPPTFTFVGDLDPFRDETITYVQTLRQHGVPVEFHLYPGGFHGFELLVPNATICKEANGTYERALKRALHPAL